MPDGDAASQYNVRAAAERVALEAAFVRIDEEAILRWANEVDPALIRPVEYPHALRFLGTPAQAARWVLLVDCLNFCFWTGDTTPWTVEYQGRPWHRYLALVAALRRAVAQDARWLDPHRWSSATAGDLEEVFAGGGRIPMLDDRVRIMNETGRVVLARYGGEPVHLAEDAGFHAAAIAGRLADGFDSFHDVPRYRGMEVPILKRAQIFAADLASAWAHTGGPAVTHLELLTAFADYRIPQVLRHLGILGLDAGLASRIEADRLIEKSSDEEVELRACSLWAVEEMCGALRAHRRVGIPPWILDEYLWERSHDSEVTVHHHRTLTWYY